MTNTSLRSVFGSVLATFYLIQFTEFGFYYTYRILDLVNFE